MLVHHLPKIKVRRPTLTSFSRFLLASLHIQSLKDKVSIRKVKEALAQLPRGSGSAASKIAYDETMNRIRGQEKGFCDLAIATLAWISLAMTPLTLRELQCALSIEPGDTAMDEADFVDEETLSSVCAGLIVVDHESRIVRLAHYTTQEYFESRKDVLFPDKQSLLATTCLTYLSFDMFSDWMPNSLGRETPISLVEQLKWSPDNWRYPDISHPYPLLNYAVRHWHKHANSSQSSTIQRLVIEFLERREKLTALLSFMYREYKSILLREPLFNNRLLIHGLPIAARYGLTDAVKALLHLEGYCAEDRSRIKVQALMLAAFYGQSSAVRILLDGNTIAPAAVSNALRFTYSIDTAPPGRPGGCEVAEILLNHGADPNTRLDDEPLIHLACKNNDVQLASLLLSLGADVELRDGFGRTALHELAERGYSGDIVKVLLENKLDIDARNIFGQTALLTAVRCSSAVRSASAVIRPTSNSQKNYRSLIKQLLECGASVDQYNNRGVTALHLAALQGALQIACQLLEAGADVKSRNCCGETAAGCLRPLGWDLKSITQEERANCKAILERYSFYGSGEKRVVWDNDEGLDSDEPDILFVFMNR